AVFPRAGRLGYLRHGSAVVREARDFSPDIVHAHYASAFGAWALKLSDYPRVVSVWGSNVVEFPSNWLARRSLRKVLQAASRITATSEYLGGVTRCFAPDLAKQITIIPFGLELPAQVEPPPEGPVRLCFIKRHKPVYGIDILLEAMHTVHRDLPEIRLTIAGEGPSTSHLKALCTRLGLDNCVSFCGLLDENGVRDLLRASHIMVMPSLQESFGVAAVEAGANARPVIATDVGGIPEIVQDGRSGLLVPPGDSVALADAIVKLAQAPDLRLTMGRNARHIVEDKYQWQRSLDRMISVYEDVLHG
ncbi:MAG: glycosyltransferase, partial [candidate division Zixibacteria bacterium]|nr:glycosyltransferase [candidate division Zixibacteria bacterium]